MAGGEEVGQPRVQRWGRRCCSRDIVVVQPELGLEPRKKVLHLGRSQPVAGLVHVEGDGRTDALVRVQACEEERRIRFNKNYFPYQIITIFNNFITIKSARIKLGWVQALN